MKLPEFYLINPNAIAPFTFHNPWAKPLVSKLFCIIWKRFQNYNILGIIGKFFYWLGTEKPLLLNSIKVSFHCF